MKVYDITKTIELTDYDLKFGYLKEDTIITHFPEIQAVEEKSHIVVVQEYPNGGKDVETIIDIPGVKYQPAHDEVEDIFVYVPYTLEQLEDIAKDKLREQRSYECFNVVNRGKLWYDTLTETQVGELREWYKDWLDVTKTRVIPEKPNWLK